MNNNKNYLRNLVLNGTANLYESFDTLFEQVAKWADEDSVTITQEQVVEGLQQAITEGYVQAYVLASQAPHSTPVSFSRDRVRDLYFYVTPKGKHLVTQQERESGASGGPPK